jgi:microcystin degradation protein MlrC
MKSALRIAVGQLWQESNTFNPIATTRADFEHFGIVRGTSSYRKREIKLFLMPSPMLFLPR